MQQREFARQFVRDNDALSEWSRIEPYLEQLKTMRVDTPQLLNEWLLNWSEVAACIEEVGRAFGNGLSRQTTGAAHFRYPAMPPGARFVGRHEPARPLVRQRPYAEQLLLKLRGSLHTQRSYAIRPLCNHYLFTKP